MSHHYRLAHYTSTAFPFPPDKVAPKTGIDIV